MSVEEQLAQVQQQLLALSQLPSTIQVTLDAVTQQLAQIVSGSQSTVEEVTYEAVVAEEQEEQEVTYVTTEGTVCTSRKYGINNSVLFCGFWSTGDRDSSLVLLEEEDEQHTELTEITFDENSVMEQSVNGCVNGCGTDSQSVSEGEQLEQKINGENEVECDSYAGLTEEEIQAKKEEEALFKKKQKVKKYGCFYKKICVKTLLFYSSSFFF